jgi:AcrR family transcriptional regulator
MKKPQFIDMLRKKPQQKRAGDTVETILEATAQVLDQDGLKGASTNAIADRAGFGVGTLYQYFRNKDALLQALMQREAQRIKLQIQDMVGEGDALSAEENVRRLAQILIRAFGARPHVRRTIVLYLSGRVDIVKAAGFAEEVATVLYDAMRWRPDIPMPSRLRFRILSRAVIGAVRGTVVLEPEKVLTKPFEDEIVALILAYLSAPEVALPAN